MSKEATSSQLCPWPLREGAEVNYSRVCFVFPAQLSIITVMSYKTSHVRTRWDNTSVHVSLAPVLLYKCPGASQSSWQPHQDLFSGRFLGTQTPWASKQVKKILPTCALPQVALETKQSERVPAKHIVLTCQLALQSTARKAALIKTMKKY